MVESRTLAGDSQRTSIFVITAGHFVVAEQRRRHRSTADGYRAHVLKDARLYGNELVALKQFFQIRATSGKRARQTIHVVSSKGSSSFSGSNLQERSQYPMTDDRQQHVHVAQRDSIDQ